MPTSTAQSKAPKRHPVKKHDEKSSRHGGAHAQTEDTFEPVALDHRRGPITMGLLWLTMLTAFPAVLIGFEWYKAGLTIQQVIACTGISCAIVLAYAVPANHIGAVTGMNWGGLVRSTFGHWGTKLIALSLVCIFIAWYGLTALFLADGLTALFHLKIEPLYFSIVLALAMALNNFFGFKGVANFARYFAAPVLIVWIAYTAIKVGYACPAAIWTQPAHKDFFGSLTLVSAFVIGFATWGNEADYARFGKPKLAYSALSVTLALLVGQVLFPVTGYVIAFMTHITEYGAATAFINTFAFGGIPLIGATVLVASYFASNDSNLFGSEQSCEYLIAWCRRGWVTVLSVLGALMAAWLSVSGASKSLEAVASLNCIILPTPTVIILAEWYLLKRILRKRSDCFQPAHAANPVRWRPAATIALVLAVSAGIVMSGIIPGTQMFHVGIVSVQTWLLALVIYVPLRLVEMHKLESELILARTVETAATEAA